MDNATATRPKRQVAENFRSQLMFGVPTSRDEAGLRPLNRQLKTGKVQVKLHLRTLLHRQDHAAPRVAYVGSRNLTLNSGPSTTRVAFRG